MTQTQNPAAKTILVLHNIEDLSKARRSTLDHIYCFERYAPQHNYVYHRSMLPVTDALRTTPWDAVIFESTSLGIVTLRPRSRFQHLREQWRFLRDIPAVKLAFPQDDATHSAHLDYFCSNLGVDAVFSVRPERKEQLYPLTSERAEFVSTVAGYIDDMSLDELSGLARPFGERRWEIGQRVTFYPAWGGRFARRKSAAALRMQQACRERGLPENVSTDPADVLVGDDWYGFLGDCRFVVGAEGGHGIWDPHGAIQDEVNDYVARHPQATFEEVEDACFLGLDGRETFPGFAPRVLEAALMGCGQVLLEGKYRGFVKPGEHYIELKDDYSNLDDVFAQMADGERVRTMIEASRRQLVENPFFRYSTLVQRCFELIERKQSERKTVPSRAIDIRTVRAQHRAQLAAALLVDLRREGFRDQGLAERAVTLLRGQDTQSGYGGEEAERDFDWAVAILPEMQRNPDDIQVTPGAAPVFAPLDRRATHVGLLEAVAARRTSRVAATLAASEGAAETQETVVRMGNALRAARRTAERLASDATDLAGWADTIDIDAPSRKLLAAVQAIRPRLVEPGVSEALAHIVESGVDYSLFLGRILRAITADPAPGRLNSVALAAESGHETLPALDRVLRAIAADPAPERLESAALAAESGNETLPALDRVLRAIAADPAPERLESAALAAETGNEALAALDRILRALTADPASGRLESVALAAESGAETLPALDRVLRAIAVDPVPERLESVALTAESDKEVLAALERILRAISIEPMADKLDGITKFAESDSEVSARLCRILSAALNLADQASHEQIDEIVNHPWPTEIFAALVSKRAELTPQVAADLAGIISRGLDRSGFLLAMTDATGAAPDARALARIEQIARTLVRMPTVLRAVSAATRLARR
jgi:hypothetical protein